MPEPIQPPEPSAALTVASRFLALLPALVAAFVLLRAAELLAGIPPGTAPAAIATLALTALVQDAIVLARFLPLLFLGALPWLLLRPSRWQRAGLLVSGASVLLLQAALLEYYLEARVPLGADLFGYSWAEVQETARAGASWNPAVLVGTLAALAAFVWLGRRGMRRDVSHLPSVQSTLLVFGIALAAWVWAPVQPPHLPAQSEDAYNLALNKSAYFLDDSWRYWRQAREPMPMPAAVAAAAAPGADPGAGLHYLDPAYPFLRAEQTPDVLGPHFRIDPAHKPRFVFIVVEGLGRAFSGPNARLGSFTPFLDELATRSLYFDNFLATQGRTFAVLPSLFASLPFGAQGFNALGAGMPAHASLPGLLKAQGYSLAFYAGFNADFDNERTFLRREGFDRLLDEAAFAPGAHRTNDWGYADGALVDLALADQMKASDGPSLALLQTISMHTPYTVPDQAHWRDRFEQRLDELGQWEKVSYRANRDIYATILYTDDALRRYFERAKKLPGYEHTIFIVTGDHRLPEIPMATRIDRYHVPMLIYSPMLVAPMRIKAVSSDFDVAPSLLAFMAHNYGLRTPKAVTWLGTGLDLSPRFGNRHDIPLKQTKTNLVDFVSGLHFLNQDTLYSLRDGMEIAPVDDAAAMTQLQGRFAAFRAANDRFAHSLALVPESTAAELADYRASDRPLPVAITAPAADLAVRDVRPEQPAHVGQLSIEAEFVNDGGAASDEFVPLVVLAAADGHEVSETYGAPLRLGPGKSVQLPMAVKSDGAGAGRYFLSVIPSHPKTGKPVGLGRYRVPVQLRD